MCFAKRRPVPNHNARVSEIVGSVHGKTRILSLSWRDIKSPNAGGAEVHTHEMLSRAAYMIWAVCTAAVAGALCAMAPNIQYVSFTYKVCVCALVPPLLCILCFGRTEEFKFVKDVLLGLVWKRRR